MSMMFATNWMARGVSPDMFLGGAAVSGVYDLSPLLECSMNVDLHLSAASAHAVSPVHLSPQLNAPLFLIAGSDESAAFCDQSRYLRDAWPNHCSRFDIISGCNHFTIVDAFVAPDNPAGQFIRQLFD